MNYGASNIEVIGLNTTSGGMLDISSGFLSIANEA